MANADLLRNALIDYDGKTTAILIEISKRHRERADFLPHLVNLVADKDPGISEGATWLIKAELERGQSLAENETERLIRELGQVTAWQAQLHICQSIRHMKIPKSLAADLQVWLGALLSSPRPLLRAWAVDALCRSESSAPRVEAILTRMESDPAGSVRARVRNLRRQFDKR